MFLKLGCGSADLCMGLLVCEAHYYRLCTAALECSCKTIHYLYVCTVIASMGLILQYLTFKKKIKDCDHHSLPRENFTYLNTVGGAKTNIFPSSHSLTRVHTAFLQQLEWLAGCFLLATVSWVTSEDVHLSGSYIVTQLSILSDFDVNEGVYFFQKKLT